LCKLTAFRQGVFFIKSGSEDPDLLFVKGTNGILASDPRVLF
jgi:hypothetical protein